MKEILIKASKIKLVIFDVDGVLTDRKLYLGDNGCEYKAFNTHDGFGLKMLMRSGIETGIISARHSPAVDQRMSELGISHVYQGQPNKIEAFEHLLQKLSLTAEQAAFVGDDIPDLPIIRRAGLGIAVADAMPFVIQHANWTTQARGGEGAAREVCELILKAQNCLNSIYEHYL